MKEIRGAEENEAARHRMTAKATSIHSHEDERVSSSVIYELKSEIQELKTHLCGGEFNSVTSSSMMLKAKDKSIKRTVNADNAKVRELRRQVQQLQKQLAVMSVSNIQQSTTITKPQHKSLSVSSRFTPTRHKDYYFCYRCGEDCHIATKCQAPSNADQGIEKLVRSLRRAKSGKPEETQGL